MTIELGGSPATSPEVAQIRADLGAAAAIHGHVANDVQDLTAAVQAIVQAFLAQGANVTINRVGAQLIIAATGGGGGGGGGLVDGNYGDVTVSGSGTIISVNANAVAWTEISGRPTLGTAAALDVAASGNASASQVVKGNDTRLGAATIPALTTDAGTRTVSEINAFLDSIRLQGTVTSLPTGATTLVAATHSGKTWLVPNGAAITVDSGSLNDGDPITLKPATDGAVFTVVVGTATVKRRNGGATVAGSTVIPSSRSQTGEISLERQGTTYYVIAPDLCDIVAAITATGAFPARTNERLQIIEVNSNSAVTLTMSAGQFPAGDMRAVVIFKYGTGALTLSGLTTQGDTATLTGKGRMVLTADPLTADQPWVAVQSGAA